MFRKLLFEIRSPKWCRVPDILAFVGVGALLLASIIVKLYVPQAGIFHEIWLALHYLGGNDNENHLL
jgi:hypothetical protein